MILLPQTLCSELCNPAHVSNALSNWNNLTWSLPRKYDKDSKASQYLYFSVHTSNGYLTGQKAGDIPGTKGMVKKSSTRIWERQSTRLLFEDLKVLEDQPEKVIPRSQRTFEKGYSYICGSRWQAWMPKSLGSFSSFPFSTPILERFWLSRSGVGSWTLVVFRSSRKGFWYVSKVENYCFRRQSACTYIIQSFVYLKRGKKETFFNAC